MGSHVSQKTARRISHVLGIDDAPFDRARRGDVRVVGALYAGLRLDGVYSTRVRRDGANATRALTELVRHAQLEHLQAILLQGIALGGFNVVDIAGLYRATGVPVLVVARKRPDLAAIRRALETRVPGGRRKWRLIERAGPMEELPTGAGATVMVQRAGLTLADARALLGRLCAHGNLPEPIRAAHLIAGGVTTGASKGRA
jgi:endonuclease V-like protein UPF0215 family